MRRQSNDEASPYAQTCSQNAPATKANAPKFVTLLTSKAFCHSPPCLLQGQQTTGQGQQGRPINMHPTRLSSLASERPNTLHFKRWTEKAVCNFEASLLHVYLMSTFSLRCCARGEVVPHVCPQRLTLKFDSIFALSSVCCLANTQFHCYEVQNPQFQSQG